MLNMKEQKGAEARICFFIQKPELIINFANTFQIH